MHVLQIEHPISDFDTWKGAFDRFSDMRQQSGVRRYQVLRPTEDPNYIIIELEFDSPSEAEAFLARLWSKVWSSREAQRQPWWATRRRASWRPWRSRSIDFRFLKTRSWSASVPLSPLIHPVAGKASSRKAGE